MYGEVPPKLAIGVTTTRAFSSHSVMTLARADVGAATANQIPIMTAGTELLNVQAVEARMFSSYLRHLQVTRANPRELTRCGSCACSAVITERTRGARDRSLPDR
jgi:hypothetical protein